MTTAVILDELSHLGAVGITEMHPIAQQTEHDLGTTVIDIVIITRTILEAVEMTAGADIAMEVPAIV
jgi:hypothetical protein